MTNIFTKLFLLYYLVYNLLRNFCQIFCIGDQEKLKPLIHIDLHTCEQLQPQNHPYSLNLKETQFPSTNGLVMDISKQLKTWRKENIQKLSFSLQHTPLKSNNKNKY